MGTFFLVVGAVSLFIIIVAHKCELCQSNNYFAEQYLFANNLFLLSNTLVEMLHDTTTTFVLSTLIFEEKNIAHGNSGIMTITPIALTVDNAW